MYDKKISIGKGLYKAWEYGIEIIDPSFVGIVDENNKEIVPVAFDSIEYSSEMNLFVCKGYPNRYTVYTKEGKGFDDYKYAEVADTKFTNPVAIVQLDDDKFNMVDKTGSILLDENYDKYVNMGEGFVALEKNDKYAIFDTTGRQLTNFEFDVVGKFKNGRVICSKNFKLGALDIKLTTAVPFNYDFISDFNRNGLAIVRKNGLEGVINKDLYPVVPITFETIDFVNMYDFIKVKDSRGKYGIFNNKGEIILPCVCDEIKHFEPSAKYIPAVINGQVAYADADGKLYQGKEAIEIKYQLKKQDLKFSTKKFLPIRYKILDVQKKIEMKKYDKGQEL